MESISRSELFKIRKEKLRKEIKAAKRLLKNEAGPLAVADKFIHNAIEMMKDGIREMYPELTENEIVQKIKENLALNDKIKSNRIRRIKDG